MQIGIFSRTFNRPDLDGVLDAVVSYGFTDVHFNLNAAGVESLPEMIEESLCRTIGQSFHSRGLKMISVSGTFNMIHPDKIQRKAGIRRVCNLIRRCQGLGTAVVSLCTGTRDPLNMWTWHPGNNAADAWVDLVASLNSLLPVAESNGVTLGIEPEKGNIINSAVKARRLLNEMNSRALKIIMDGANLFEPDNLSDMQQVLEEAFDLLGSDLVSVHAKDITEDAAKKDQAAGTGHLDWETYFRLLNRIKYDGPVILHNLREEQVDASLAFVRDGLERWSPQIGRKD